MKTAFCLIIAVSSLLHDKYGDYVKTVITDGRTQKVMCFSVDSTWTTAAIGDSVFITYNAYNAMRDTVIKK